MSNTSPHPSPYKIHNIRLFIAFRIFFNSRFYYPVFTILFLDFGLTIEQFAILNSVWAITIVLAEVPSGALADILGRKYLLVATALLMMIEMSLLAFVPLGNATIIFWAFLINRILSGLAEAMASGADEAIAYDSLIKHGNPDHWPKVLSLQLRLRSVISIITMTLGALLYDPNTVNKALGLLGINHTFDQQTTMRFPIYLTLVLAILATSTALRMVETAQGNQEDTKVSAGAVLKQTLQAGLWIGRTPFALAVILFGMCYDHILRMLVTMTSQYFRLINLPEASFGVIGAFMGLLGLVVPKIAEKMVSRFSPQTNMIMVSVCSLITLSGLSLFIPYWGLIPMGLIFGIMMFVSFFTSHYLNQITASHHRATVLSFKGLAFNLAYGLIGFFFAVLISHLRGNIGKTTPGLPPSQLENSAFIEGISWFPSYTLFFLLLLIIFSMFSLRNTKIHKHVTKQTSQSKIT